MQVSSFHFGPHHTPRLIKGLIFVIVCLSLLSPVLTYFLHYFNFSGPQEWFPLSLEGFIGRSYFWELLTYFFLQTGHVHISFSLLVSLAFQMFLLWFTGSEILIRFGTWRFFLIFLGGGIFAGLVTLACLFLFASDATLTGSTPALFSLLIGWTLLYPNLDLTFFFLIRLKAKWVVIWILGLSLLIDITQGAYFSLIADLAGIIWGFLSTWFFLQHDIQSISRKKRSSSPKIVDIEVLKKTVITQKNELLFREL